MAKMPRDVERMYSTTEVVAKLRRLADARWSRTNRSGFRLPVSASGFRNVLSSPSSTSATRTRRRSSFSSSGPSSQPSTASTGRKRHRSSKGRPSWPRWRVANPTISVRNLDSSSECRRRTEATPSAAIAPNSGPRSIAPMSRICESSSDADAGKSSGEGHEDQVRPVQLELLAGPLPHIGLAGPGQVQHPAGHLDLDPVGRRAPGPAGTLPTPARGC